MGFFFIFTLTKLLINMKFRTLLSIIALTCLFFTSCSDDNSTKENNQINNPGDNNAITVVSEWNPSSLQIIKLIPLETFEYPHQVGCEKDYLQLLSNNTGKFISFNENDCAQEVYEQAFTRSNDQVTLNLNGYTISGTLQETDNQMILSSPIDDYLPFIQTLYPEAEQYLPLLEGATIKLLFTKKI